MRFTSPRFLSFPVGLICCVVTLFAAASVQAQLTEADWSSSGYGEGGVCNECCADTSCSYGPCDCRPRMTLFQWSYGTSFAGGASLDEPLVTDRPDFTESSSTVGRGVNQIEMGYTYTHDESGNTSTRSHSYPEILWRRGIVAEWLELRIGWNYGEERVNTGGTVANQGDSDDIYLGFKIALTPQECWLPEMALLPQMTIPVGGPFSAEEVLPGLNWLYSWEVNDWLSIAGSTQGNRALDEVTGDAYIEFAQSAAAGISLTDTLGVYAEWYAFLPSSADTAQNEHYFNGGFAYLLSDNVQLDIRAGVGLNGAADDYFIGTGASFRH